MSERRGTGVEIRPIELDDLPKLCQSLARAFYDDPLSIYIFPGARRRLRRLERWFQFQLRTLFIPRGQAWASSDLLAASLWMPPGSWPPKVADGASQLPALAILGLRIPRTVRITQMLEARHPHTPHFYLGTIGTDPSVQRKGYGSALMRVVLDQCDREGIPSYLESSKASNLSFYNGHGYEVVDEILIPHTDQPIWLMWREPSG